MRILAHRGFWKAPAEKNSRAALWRALEQDFGLETDVRDAQGELVISHDPATSDALPLSELLAAHARLAATAPLALNIKADGLRSRLRDQFRAHGTTAYFCFDMSVPESLAYQREGFRFFTRESEYERTPVLYAAAAGVWLDMFHDDWASPDQIRSHVAAGKEIAVVSPELHGRSHLMFWERLRTAGLGEQPAVLLCTDFPDAARAFFHG